MFIIGFQVDINFIGILISDPFLTAEILKFKVAIMFSPFKFTLKRNEIFVLRSISKVPTMFHI